MKSIIEYIIEHKDFQRSFIENKDFQRSFIENKDFQRSFNESQDKDFSDDEIGKIMKDTWDKNGKFYKLLKELDYKSVNNDIKDFLEQCLDDDRVAAQFASYISDLIGRDNFSIEQVQKFIKTNDIVG